MPKRELNEYHPEAENLNRIICQYSKNVFNMLSEKGKAIYFPHKGILAQSAQAQGKKINATIGIALEEDSKPMHLKLLGQQVQLPPEKIFPYAPSFGRPEIRKKWLEMMLGKDPLLKNKPISLPVVTSALTNGLSIAGYLFGEPGEMLLLSDLYWENYNLIFHHSYGLHLKTYNSFTNNGFDLKAFEAGFQKKVRGKRIVLLNFPNNPSGYTATQSEAEAIVEILKSAANRGNKIVVLVDDAYYGLVYEEKVLTGSLFSMLADLHENILAIKIDGPTKEDYVWGFRIGFITYGIKGGTPQFFEALEAKTAAAIRATNSNNSNLAQSMLLKAWENPQIYQQEKKEKFNILKNRYLKVRSIFKQHPEYLTVFSPLPFNSGYFMCVQPLKGDVEMIRKILLEKYSTGVIADKSIIRIAFSAVPLALMDELFKNLYQAIRETTEQSN